MNNKQILETANASITTGDYEGFLSFCADDTVWTFVGEQTLHGKEAVRQYMAETYLGPPKFNCMSAIEKIGLGGSCHWCTEAIFQSLKGVIHVSQGWIEPDDSSAEFSEAVVVEFDPILISLESLIGIHLHTHSCTSEHSMRSKYRSAVYTFSEEQLISAKQAIDKLQTDFEDMVITKVFPFKTFKLNNQKYLDYYYKNPDKPFCKTFIDPKLKILLHQFSSHVKDDKMKPADLAADLRTEI